MPSFFAQVRQAKRQANAVERSMVRGGRAPMISRQGGTFTGAMGKWNPRYISYPEEGRQREVLTKRTNDLVANDPHACSLIESITINTVGPGLWPQSKPKFKRIPGLDKEQAKEIAEQAEWEFELFNREADASGVSDYYGIQFQNLWSLLVNGEYLNLPLMLDDPSRRYRLAIQALDPSRMRTPSDQSAILNVRDGIRLGDLGQPVGYFIANPPDGMMAHSMFTTHFDELPPKRGHRHVVMHRFHKKTPEQVRGVSVLAPALSFFRNFADYMDYELLGAIIAASFPVWIEKNAAYDAQAMPSVLNKTDEKGNKTYHQHMPPGQVIYGNSGEKPHMLKGDRPTNSFEIFVETALRAFGAATGMPYEIVAKDFSKTNYSSARAALQEAWRVFELYQDLLVNFDCQPIWEMMFEEAVLRKRIIIPGGLEHFYQYRAEYCAATWIGPARTNVDPVKEMVANIMGLNIGTTTRADICAGSNKDWEEQIEQGKREKEVLIEAGLPSEPPSVPESKDPVMQYAAGDDEADISASVVTETTAPANSQPTTEAQPDHDGLRKELDAYGIGVRSGSLTAQPEDEEAFRAKAGWPSISKAVKAVWTKAGNFRLPVTLQQDGDTKAAPAGSVEDDDNTDEK